MLYDHVDKHCPLVHTCYLLHVECGTVKFKFMYLLYGDMEFLFIYEKYLLTIYQLIIIVTLLTKYRQDIVSNVYICSVNRQ